MPPLQALIKRQKGPAATSEEELMTSAETQSPVLFLTLPEGNTHDPVPNVSKSCLLVVQSNNSQRAVNIWCLQ